MSQWPVPHLTISLAVFLISSLALNQVGQRDSEHASPIFPTPAPLSGNAAGCSPNSSMTPSAAPGDIEQMALWALSWFADPPGQQFAEAAAVVAATRSVLSAHGEVDEWLNRNWQRSRHLAVFKLSEGITAAAESAHYIVRQHHKLRERDDE